MSNQHEQANAQSRRGASHCSASELVVLKAVSYQNWLSAKSIAARAWMRLGNASKRAGQWQRMGAMLHNLYARGLVHKMTTKHAQNLWRRKRTPND